MSDDQLPRYVLIQDAIEAAEIKAFFTTRASKPAVLHHVSGGRRHIVSLNRAAGRDER